MADNNERMKACTGVLLKKKFEIFLNFPIFFFQNLRKSPKILNSGKNRHLTDRSQFVRVYPFRPLKSLRSVA